MSISIGDQVTDKVSGLTGIVTAKVEYMTGCIQYLITPKWVKGTVFAEGHWVDDMRLERILPKEDPSTPEHIHPAIVVLDRRRLHVQVDKWGQENDHHSHRADTTRKGPGDIRV